MQWRRMRWKSMREFLFLPLLKCYDLHDFIVYVHAPGHWCEVRLRFVVRFKEVFFTFVHQINKRSTYALFVGLENIITFRVLQVHDATSLHNYSTKTNTPRVLAIHRRVHLCRLRIELTLRVWFKATPKALFRCQTLILDIKPSGCSWKITSLT